MQGVNGQVLEESCLDRTWASCRVIPGAVALGAQGGANGGGRVRTKPTIGKNAVEFEELCSTKIDVFDLWDGLVSRQYLADSMVEWIYGLSDWRHMVTLTYRWEIGYYKALAMFRALLNRLGKAEVGKKFSRAFGESYFGYVMGIEYQARGVIHFHMIVDNWIDYKLVHELWNAWAGFAWVEPVRSKESVCKYIAKYLIKNNDVYQFVPKRSYIKKKDTMKQERMI